MAYKNELNLGFSISEYNDISHQEISTLLNIEPYKVYIKGEFPNNFTKRKSTVNSWCLGTPYGNYDDFETQMNEILDLLEPKIEILKELSNKYYCEFSCAIFLYNREESTPWIHLNDRYLNFTRQVKVEFDFDIYYPPDADESSD